MERQQKENAKKLGQGVFMSRDGTVRYGKTGKTLGPVCHMNWLKCTTKLSDDERILLFNRFWDLGNREKQWAFIANLVVKQKK